jgi:uncharacterized protein (DUF2461 family)
MTRFEGFADKSGTFFKRLARNNDRAWFLEHKSAPLVEWLTFATA